MKNKLFILFFSALFNFNVFAETSVNIQARNITLDKDKITSIFENDVVVKTEDKTFFCDFVKYNKKAGFLILKKNVIARDSKNNIIKTQHAEFDEKSKIFKTIGLTSIITSENYEINAKDIIFNNKTNTIISKKKSIINDQDKNQIFLTNFEYNIPQNIFKSIGLVKIRDKNENVYEFSQLYIDTKKKEILGTDIKAFLNDKSFKIKKENKPRIFANTINLSEKLSSFSKSKFTLCDYRENDKCPPWTIQATEMLHDNKKKTVYYENAVIKVYDIPIFYFPKLSHPDPTVERRSGFLPPSLSDSKNLGSGITIPYFFSLGKDKNFTLTNRLFTTENPLFLGEYHQAFKNSEILADFGFTEGYKNTSVSKRGGDKSHLFSKFIKNFKKDDDSNSSLVVSLQDVSNDKYLKLYKIESNLVDYNTDTLENSINFTHENEDIFFGLNASVYETLKENYDDKYEYILPEITIDKNLFSDNKFGKLDLQTNFKVHNYETNKLTSFLINDFNWSSRDSYLNNGLKTKVLGNIKNINYEAKNVGIYKDSLTNELFGSVGIMSELKMEKINSNSKHNFIPKVLLRLSPGNMRKESSGSKLDPINAFSLNRLDNINNYETGINATLGFDYNIVKKDKNFDFSVAQIINEKENKKMPDETSLNEKLSDLVGTANLTLSKKFNLNYNFALDQNYSDLNYSDIGTSINFGLLDMKLNFLQEKKHIGNQDYFKTKINLKNKEKGVFAFETKRNLITNSAEFYNLSYEYINDCLRAGLVYRREFYNDSEIEPENSLMFKITLTPFGSINSPTFSK